MVDVLPALVTAGVGVVLLVVVLLVALAPVRRLGRTVAASRAALRDRTGALRALVNARDRARVDRGTGR